MPSYELPSAGIWSTLHIDSSASNSSSIISPSRPSFTAAGHNNGYSYPFPANSNNAIFSLPSEWRQRGEALSQSLRCDRTKSARHSSDSHRASALKWHNLYNNPLLSSNSPSSGPTTKKTDKWTPPVLDSRFTYVPPPASRGSVPYFSPSTFDRIYSPLTPRDQLILSCVEFDLKAQPERVYRRRDADEIPANQRGYSQQHRYNNNPAEQILAASAAAAGLHSDSSIQSNSMAGSIRTSSGVSSDDIFSGSASLSGVTSSSTSQSGGDRRGGRRSSGDESSHGWTTAPRDQQQRQGQDQRRHMDDSHTNSMEFGSPVTHRTDMSSLLGLTPLTVANNTNRSQQPQRDELSEGSDLSLLSPLTPVSFLSTGRPSSNPKPPRHTMNRAASAGGPQPRLMKQQQAAVLHQEFLDEAARVRDIVRAEQAKQAGSIQRLLSSGASRASPPLESIPSGSSSNEHPGSSLGSGLTSSSSNNSPSSNFHQRGSSRFEQPSPSSYFGRDDDYSRRTQMDSELLSITHLSHSD